MNNLYWECEKCGHKTPRHPDTKAEEMPLCHQIDKQSKTYKCCCGRMVARGGDFDFYNLSEQELSDAGFG